MPEGITTTGLDQVSLADEVIVNRAGSTGRLLVDDLATQLLAAGAMAEEIAALRLAQTTGLVSKASWAELQLLIPTVDGSGGEVLDGTAGTHLQATATGYDGAAVANAGRYTWVHAWSRWVRIGATGLSAKADATSLTAETGNRVAADALLTTNLGAVAGAFDIVPTKQRYDKTVAVDAAIMSYFDGSNAAFATGMALGYFGVEPGKAYCLSMSDPLGFHAAHALYCRNAAGGFLGIDHTIGATPGMASPPTGVVWTGNAQVIFTIPADSLIRFIGVMANYSTHITADFNRVIGTVQAEEGTTPTAYQEYNAAGLRVLKSSALPPTAASTDPARPTKVVRAGSDIYIRGAFSAALDIITRVSLSAGGNNTVNQQGVRTAAKTVVDTVSAYNGGTILATGTDDTAPLYYNGTYIGGNHGANFVRQLPATAHGKVVQDVGSIWMDSAGVKWCLIRIVDANTLWVLAENTAVYPAWAFTTTITGANLTHFSGATNTAAIPVAGNTLTQLWPSLQAQTVRVLLDGVTELASDGSAMAGVVQIINEYNITNPAAVRSYVASQVGGASAPDLLHASIAHDVRRSLTYAYAENGSCTIYDGVFFKNPVTLGYYGVTQAMPLNLGAGEQLMQYIPRTLPVAGGIKSWNFQAMENIAGTMEELHVTAAYFSDPNNPPDRMAQIVRSSAGVAKFGLMVGYSPIRSLGVPALRKTLVADAAFVSAIRKQYPKALTVSAQPAGAYYEAVAFRTYWDATADPDTTTLAWYRDGRKIILTADFHSAVSQKLLRIPLRFVGMNVTVIDKTATVTLHGNGVAMAEGIRVSSSAGYGYIILQLSE